MKFYSFNNFNFMFDEGKQPLTVTVPTGGTEYNEDGEPVTSNKTYHVNEPIINNTNPNLTYTNTDGGQQSMMSTVWESLAIKNAPRNTIVKDSKGHTFKVVSSLQVTFTDLYYYQLKETGDES